MAPSPAPLQWVRRLITPVMAAAIWDVYLGNTSASMGPASDNAGYGSMSETGILTGIARIPASGNQTLLPC
jgi:hypothetical protein